MKMLLINAQRFFDLLRIYFFICEVKDVGQKVLTRDDREAIFKGWERGDSAMDIAYRLGVSMTTVYNELRRGQTDEFNPDTMRWGYDPDKGAQTYMDNIKKRGNRAPRMEAAANE